MSKFTLAKVVVVSILFTCNAHALQLKDLLGDWGGKRKETRSGVGYSWSVKVDCKRRSDGGFLMIEKGSAPSYGSYTNRHVFRGDGKYSHSAATGYGLIFMSGSGTWKVANGQIVISGRGANTSGTSNFSGAIKLVKKDKLVYSGTSGSTKVVITGNRR
jgi:hypothetical protein